MYPQITNNLIDISFDLTQDRKCRLIQPNKPELEHLRREWFKPRDFIRRMRLSGLNIFPDVDSSKYVSTQSKVCTKYIFNTLISYIELAL